MSDPRDGLLCPACKGALGAEGPGLVCAGCATRYAVEDGVPLLFLPNDWAAERPDITGAMKAFYEATPFPNYDDCDDIAALAQRARRGRFARMLGEQLPFGSRILECGCGTGQLTNFLASANRTVVGSDISVSSLKLAQAFKRRNELDGARFVQMNLFRPAFPEQSFDWVISNGVLHHTSDPRGAFASIASLVRPGGYILIGLYHTFGRLLNDARRLILRWTRDRLRFIDPRLRRPRRALAQEGAQSERRIAAWFADQYRNPHESKHTINEVMAWLREAGFSFVKSIPKNRIGQALADDEELTAPDEVGGRWERGFKEIGMTFTHARDGGLFVVIGRRER